MHWKALEQSPVCRWNLYAAEYTSWNRRVSGDTVGAKVGPYFSLPLILLPLAQCRRPNFHMFLVSVGLTVDASTDYSMSVLWGSDLIGWGLVKTQ